MRTYMYCTKRISSPTTSSKRPSRRSASSGGQRRRSKLSTSFHSDTSTPARDGLQASQQLYLALKQMDVAYQDSRGGVDLADHLPAGRFPPVRLLVYC